MKNFALIGVAGYIAPRHMQAIKETENRMTAALDKHDSAGIIDSYFPHADFFVEFERFDRHVDKLRHTQKRVNYVSICTPNYLHDAHIRFALRNGADAICEKPLVLNPWNVEALMEAEKQYHRHINTILQLRLHPSIQTLKERYKNTDKIHDVDLTYITSRGRWYFASWKGNITQSGGVATNIGIHFFDILTWIFGDVQSNTVHVNEPKRASGFLQLTCARVRWYLSVDENALPESAIEKGQRTYRSITIDGEEVEFSSGFTDLHTQSYQYILQGKGFGIKDAARSIQTVYEIRRAKPVGLKGDYHPFARKPIEYHPFYPREML